MLKVKVSTKVDISSPIDVALAMKTANLACGWGLPVCESRFDDRMNAGAALHPLDSLILEFALEEPTLRSCVTKPRSWPREILGFRAFREWDWS